MRKVSMFFIFSLLGLGLPLGAMERDGEDDKPSSFQQLKGQLVERKAEALRLFTAKRPSQKRYDELHRRHTEAMQSIRKRQDISRDPDEQIYWRGTGNAEDNNFSIIETVQGYVLPYEWSESDELPSLIELTKRRSKELEDFISNQRKSYEKAELRLGESGVLAGTVQEFKAYTNYVQDREPFLNELNQALRNYSAWVYYAHEISRLQHISDAWDTIFTYLPFHPKAPLPLIQGARLLQKRFFENHYYSSYEEGDIELPYCKT